MKYEKCVRCPKLDERKCDGPNFAIMTLAEIVEWARARKDYLKITNEEIADRANMPLGTVAPFMAGRLKNATLETIRPILMALVGGDLGEHPCPDSESLAALEAELIELREFKATVGEDHRSKINYLKHDIDRLEAQLDDAQGSIRRKEKTIAALCVVVGLLALFIISVLIYDKLNPDIGWIRAAAANLGIESIPAPAFFKL